MSKLIVSRDAVPVIVISAVALLLSVVALLFTILGSNPLGNGLEQYDFSTPEAAMKSELDMNVSSDVKAIMELSTMRTHLLEKRSSIEVHKQASYQGKKLLFVTYTESGEQKHEIRAYSKNVDSGFWLRDFVSANLMDDDECSRTCGRG